MSTASPPLLELQEVSKTFEVRPMLGQVRRVEALREVSFSLKTGKALAIVGESGSGKSTAARAIVRLFAPTSGRILFRGEDIAGKTGRDRLAYQRSVQMVFQDPFAALNPAHTIRHHLIRPIAIHRRLRGRMLETAAAEALAEVELDPAVTLGKYPHELSGGQRQRVNLARALAVGADLIIADEPTSMLDVSIRRSILDLIGRLKRERNIAFLYITHDIATAHYLAEETVVMFAGQVVEWGPSQAIISNPGHPYTKVLLSAVPNAAVRLSSDAAARQAFSATAERVRKGAMAPGGPPVEVTPGHFVRHRQLLDAVPA